MQEEVGWDPIVHPEPGPLQKLYVIYLFVVVVIWFTRSLSLFRLLYLGGKPVSLDVIYSGSGNADAIANAAVKCEYSDNSPAAQVENEFTVLGTLEKAEIRFLHLWNETHERVLRLRRHVWQTLLFSFFISCVGLSNTFEAIQSSKSTGMRAIAGGLREVTVLFAMGLMVCALLYGVSSFFEGALAKRRTEWDYFRAKIMDRLRDNKVVTEQVR